MAKGKASTIVLTEEERRELESLTRRRKTGQALALRARIVLVAAEGGNNGQIAERLRIFRGTVGKWRERFARHRLEGLHDEPPAWGSSPDWRRGDRRDGAAHAGDATAAGQRRALSPR